MIVERNVELKTCFVAVQNLAAEVELNNHYWRFQKFLQTHANVPFMPDAFFTSSKPRKRKRVDSGTKGNSGSATKFSRKGLLQGNAKHGSSKVNGVQNKKRRVADEELSDHTDEGEGGIDDMDLRAEEEDVGASGEEDDEETPAEKRLRLAKLYLESVKESLGKFHKLYSSFINNIIVILFQLMASLTLPRSTKNLYLRDSSRTC